MQRSNSDNQLPVPRIVIDPPPEDVRPRAYSDVQSLPEQTRQEVFQWAISELVEQNRANESTNRRQKVIIACLGTTTAALTLAVGITELVKALSN